MTDPSKAPYGVRGDRPVTASDVDLFGFTEIAEELAGALVGPASKDGIVVGIEGEWGSGKSSVLELTTHALRQLPEERRPVLLAFQPWLIGNRDALLTSLFNELARTVKAIRPIKGNGASATLNELSENLRKFGSRVGSLAPLASLASLAGVPFAERAASILSHIGALLKQEQKLKPLADAKEEIDGALSTLPRRIIVTIDDVDRL